MESQIPHFIFDEQILSAEEIKFLAEVGFFSIEIGYSYHAEYIFLGLKDLRPLKAEIYFGLILSLMSQKKLKEAFDYIDYTSKANIYSEELELLSAMLLRQSGYVNDSEKKLHKIYERSQEKTIKDFVKYFLYG